jgi:hypothetical protein
MSGQCMLVNENMKRQLLNLLETMEIVFIFNILAYYSKNFIINV